VKPGSNLAESSKEGYGSKRAVLQMMIMVIIFVVLINFNIRKILLFYTVVAYSTRQSDGG
jgi:type IV secretory pathway VirB3-like protein